MSDDSKDLNGDWTIFDLSSGLFVGRTFHGTRASLALNIPSGCGAVEGRHDYLSRRVDIESGEVVEYQPPQPSPDHEWNATTKRWALSAAVQERNARRGAARAQIAALESAQVRPQRELLLDPTNADARKRLEAIEIQIITLRSAANG
jgi:hypothetical protein